MYKPVCRSTGTSCTRTREFGLAVATESLLPVQPHPLNFAVTTVLLIPAIDLKSGRCVRLKQGDMDQAIVLSEDPAAMAQHWAG